MQKSYNLFLVLMLFGLLLMSSCATSKKSLKSIAEERAKHIETVLKALDTKKLPAFIKEWTGTPYKLGGMDKKGIDCSGFALLLQKEIYGKQLYRRSVDQASQIEEKKSLKEGDLIFFSFSGKEIDHVGVYLKDNYFVHASTTRGVIIEDINLKAYKEAFVKGGSINKK